MALEACAVCSALWRSGEDGVSSSAERRSVEPVRLSAAATASACGWLRACSCPSDASRMSLICKHKRALCYP